MATTAAPKSESEPTYEMLVEENVMAEMRDGVGLAVDVFRPDAEGEFPALLSVTAYNKAVERPAVAPQPFSLEYAMCEAGDYEYWATRGYAHVIADTRGTGHSEGTFEGPWSPQEARDSFDLVEWIAAREWCSGSVGMLGLSYMAITQFFAAAQRPPHLKAIFPLDGFADAYRDCLWRGGIPFVGAVWFDRIVAAHSKLSVAEEAYDERDLERRVESVLADEANSLAKSPAALMALRSPPAVRSTSFDFLVHPEDGPFWRERSAVEQMDRIEVPTYLGSEMHTHPVGAGHLAGANWAWETIDAPKKLAFRPHHPAGLMRPFHEFHDEIKRWYDHWLRGIDTGIMDEPPVKVWVRGREDWRYSEEWPPLAITDWKRVYLRGEGRLTIDDPPTEDEAAAEMDYEPMLGFASPPGPLTPPPTPIRYLTEPLEQDTEVVGSLAVYLQASLSADNGDFIVSVRDVDPDGNEMGLTRGWLRASHRELDHERSHPWRPFHPHANPTPVKPGERYEFAIGLQPIANLFKQGHRLALEIWPCDYPNPANYDWTQAYGILHGVPFGKAVSYRIHHVPDAPSYLLLPVMRD
jgi:putative CocE/NonD family hydrolase